MSDDWVGVQTLPGTRKGFAVEMTRFVVRRNLLAWLVVGAVAGVTATAHAQAPVTITDPWVRATVPGQKATGAFLQITAHEAVTLVGGKTPVAPVVEIHEMKMVGDRMQMRALPNGLAIGAGQTVALEPGGYHVMLIDLPKAVEVGQKVPLTLTFTTANGERLDVDIEAEVRPLGRMGRPMSHGGLGHGPQR